MRVLSNGDIQFTVPRRFNERQLPGIIDAHQEQINQLRSRHEHFRDSLPGHLSSRPDTIHLQALNKSWRVVYEECSRPSYTSSTVLLPADFTEQQISKGLQNWLSKQAKQVLPGWLNKQATLHQLNYGKVTIRGQRTRWGSCSIQQHISLNRNLLFLDLTLVEYVLCHELCHTEHMNHSREFWKRLEQCVPLVKKYDKELANANKLIPLWAI